MTQWAFCGSILITMKTKDFHIRITDDGLKKIEELAKKDKIRKTQIVERALENYLKARKILKG